MHLMHLLRSPVPSKEINIRDIICLIKVFERGRLISHRLADVNFYRPNLCIKAEVFCQTG